MRGLIKIGILIALLLALMGLIRGQVGSYSFNLIDTVNLQYEKSRSQESIDREVLIKAVYDREYEDFCLEQRGYGLFFNGGFYFVEKWTTEEWITNTVNRASKSFEHQFGIKLVLAEIEEWHPASWDSLGLIKELREKIPLDDCDMVIGFSGRAADLTSRAEMPHQGSLGNYVIQGFYLPEEWSMQWLKYIFNSYHIQSYVLTREMGHIFGAVHPEEIYPAPSSFEDFWNYIGKTFSVMNAITGIFTTHFDQHNRETILQNKHLPFNSPLNLSGVYFLKN